MTISDYVVIGLLIGIRWLLSNRAGGCAVSVTLER